MTSFAHVNFQGNYTSKGPNIGDGSGNGIAEFLTGFVSAMGQRTPGIQRRCQPLFRHARVRHVFE